MRSAFSLIELTVVVLLMALSAAVVLPRWGDFRTETTLNAASTAIWSDVQALRRHATRHSQPLTVVIPAGGTTMTISPALPTVIGDATGTVDYGARYSGVTISSTPCDTGNPSVLDFRGDLTDGDTGQRLDSAVVQISYAGRSVSFDLQESFSIQEASADAEL